jgi:hypothetical protein
MVAGAIAIVTVCYVVPIIATIVVVSLDHDY